MATRRRQDTPVIGLTGTGGAGKSSVTDELLNRFLASFPDMRIAVISVDPTRRRTGGALLGDRIRMNSLRSKRVFMRSMATRRQHVATNVVLKDCIGFLRGRATTWSWSKPPASARAIRRSSIWSISRST
jgi:methylmalonyl-CoA mutase